MRLPAGRQASYKHGESSSVGPVPRAGRSIKGSLGGKLLSLMCIYGESSSVG